MAPHSSTFTWKIPWMEEPGRLQSMGSLRVGHDWATSLSLFTFVHWRRKWQPTPVFLPGESQGRGAWWAAIYGVAQSQTWLKRLSSSSMLGITWGSRCQRIPSSEKLLTQITANTWHSRDLNSHLILKPDWFNKARVMEILLPFTVNWRKCLALCGSLGIWWPPKNFLSSCTCRSWSLFFKPPWIWVGLWLITGILWWYCGFFSCVHG